METIKCCKPSILCDIPLVRDDCVDIPLVRVIVEVVLESFKCEVIVVGIGFEPNPSSERLIVVLTKCPSL